MGKIEPYERRALGAFDRGELKSVATKAEMAKFKSAARATAIKDRRINIRLSSGDLSDIPVRALEGTRRQAASSTDERWRLATRLGRWASGRSRRIE